MRVLVACEYSGRVRRAFAGRGHRAFSCDILPADDGETYFHFQEDVRKMLDYQWDLIIAHPPCTYLTNSVEWAYGDGPYHQNVKPDTLVGWERRRAREEAIKFWFRIWKANCPKICIENPVGTISQYVKPTQYIQPYEYGEDASKKTCLWLKGLPPLKPTKYVEPRIVDGKKRWGNQTDSGQNKMTPSDSRGHDRSLTPQGWADAMACQWG